MGLDSYLYKKSFIWQSEWVEAGKKQRVVVKTGGFVDKKIKSKRIKYVIEEMGYWRKANHIHAWFVDNVQDGVDNCADYYVDGSHLNNLLEDCKKVMEDFSQTGGINADSILPTSDGCFFGGTEYDEYYFDSVKETIGILEDCLSDEDADSFYYSSSW